MNVMAQSVNRLVKFVLCAGLGVLTLMLALAAPAALDFSAELLLKIKGRYGEAASTRVLRWQTLIDSAKDLPEK